MKRPEHAALPSGVPGGLFTDEQWSKKYPLIVSYLMEIKYDDGGVREPSALSIRAEGGEVQLALNDKDLKCSLYTQSRTVMDALKLMEEALLSGKGQWRPWKTGKKK